MLQNPATRFTRAGTADAAHDFVAIAAKNKCLLRSRLFFARVYFTITIPRSKPILWDFHKF